MSGGALTVLDSALPRPVRAAAGVWSPEHGHFAAFAVLHRRSRGPLQGLNLDYYGEAVDVMEAGEILGRFGICSAMYESVEAPVNVSAEIAESMALGAAAWRLRQLQ